MVTRPVARLAAVALPLAAACASAGTAPIESRNGTDIETVRLDATGGRGSEMRLSHTDAAIEATLSAAPERAFAVLPDVYEAVGLKINTVATDARTLGINGVRIRRIAREPLSRFVTCGNDALGNPLADSYSVTFTALSRVTPLPGGGSVLSTQVVATARAMSVSGNPIACQSTGLLEDRIAKNVQSLTAR